MSLIVYTVRLYTVIEVRDNGVGINESERKQIFEPFYSSKNTNFNWGMGLYHVRTIVRSHLGTLRVEKPAGGRGGLFHPPAALRRQDAQGGETDKMTRILVAEDFDIIREDLCDTLNAQSDMCVVGQASSGAEITALAGSVDCDLILMDIEMETTTAGIKAAEEILEEHPDIMVLFLTAHETENMILTSMGAGAVDYIVKGCPDEELLMHIRSAAAGRPMLDAKIQNMLLKEYSRLRSSEKSLLFFINSVSKLTAAERELVRLLLEDKKVKEIAELRCVELVTVKTQIKSLLRKFGCSRTREIVETIRELNVAHLF